MSMYDLGSSVNGSSAFQKQSYVRKGAPLAWLFVALALLVGFGLGLVSYGSVGFLAKKLNLSLPQSVTAPTQTQNGPAPQSVEYVPQTTQEDAVIGAVKAYSPAVVSIIITKDVPIYEQYYTNQTDPWGFWNFQVPQVRQNGTQPQEVGAGSGFIISDDGMALTNKHVVQDAEAEYTAITADGQKYPVKVLALDPAQDLAVLKIAAAEGQKFPAVKLGDSSNLQIGQSVIAIGNTLGEFSNTVSVGVISGLQRSITAGGGGTNETLENLIQTDAAINEGNSGGPLLNLKGEVIGINTAMASGAQSVGFVLPINLAKRDIDQVKASGKITYPYLGVYYTIIDDQIQKDNSLAVNYGAWVTTTNKDNPKSKIASVVAGSPARLAGIKDQDIILEINGEKIANSNTLSQIIAKYAPGDKVTLKIQRNDQQISLEVTLGDRSDYE
jgi:S1-C subfamily serine protease